MSNIWQLQEAKSKLSELIIEAQAHGPQVITKRGVETAVVLSHKDYKKLVGRREGIVSFFRNSPLADGDLDLTRPYSPIREAEIS